ncbi:MAG: histidine phosphatase family protein [Rhodococcus sp.]|nr:histidine phosphatase family protein [Rhodococcus sp. (in: high G+C Gram-positive bacteria)]
MRRLILLRHGQTEYNATNRMQGQLDTELSELGRAQAKAAAVVLAEREPVAIISSDLRRAFDTAVALGDSSGLPVQVDDRLRETHLGRWQGLTHHEVDARDPGARLVWRGDSTFTPPGGESRVDVARRSLPAVADAHMKFPQWGERPLVMVAHGGLIAALTAALLDLPIDHWPMFGGLGNTSWVQLSSHPVPERETTTWRLDVWNASSNVANDIL